MKILRELRLERGMSQVELGKLLGVTGSQIGMLEQGKREPSIKILIKLSEVFNVPVDFLVRDDHDNVSKTLANYYNDNCFPYSDEDQCILEFCKELLAGQTIIKRKLTFLTHINNKVFTFPDRKIHITKAKRALFAATIEAILDEGLM